MELRRGMEKLDLRTPEELVWKDPRRSSTECQTSY